MKRVMGIICAFGLALCAMPNAGSLWAQSPLPGTSMISSVRQRISWHSDLNSGWRESIRTGRPMVIFITSARCRYCDAMKHATWNDFGVEDRVNREFVAVQLNPETNAAELSRVKVGMYPTTLVAAPKGKVIGHREGFQPPELLHELLNRASSHR